MLRQLHKFPGLIAALLIVTMALSGAVLSVLPAWEAAMAPALDQTLTVATLAERVSATFPGVEQIRRSPAGQITAFYFEAGRPGAVVIDPATGKGIADHAPSGLARWVTNLHRSLFLGDVGRWTAAAGAAALLVLSLSGVMLMRRRVGGWRQMFSRLRGPVAGRLHTQIARLSVAGFVLSSVTALLMTASTFDVLPNGTAPAFPAQVSGRIGATPGTMPLLQDTPVQGLRELTFPYAGDPTDVFALKTNRGEGFIDQGTGATLLWADAGFWQRFNEVVFMLHTGQGMAWLGLILGLMALGVPVMAVTGVAIWLKSYRARPRMIGNAAAAQADTILLVGSEGGSTWGFAATLHAALRLAGHKVHAAPMTQLDLGRYNRAARVIVLTATYGDGVAPASAKGFLDRLAALPHAPTIPLAVLGFGDRQFPQFCAYAGDVARVARVAQAKGWPNLLPMATIDRQSPQEFARWGRDLGNALRHALDLAHSPAIPRSHPLTLISRREYGTDMQTPAAILRFACPQSARFDWIAGRGFGRFGPGDLLGILPTGSPLPRFYSLACATHDGFIEVCISRVPGGLCSGQLLDLAPGDTVQAFVRPNPDFKPTKGRKPVILIGAGTGIGPLAGFARANTARRPLHLYFGTRHPDHDLFYGEELAAWQNAGKLASVTTAFSRTNTRAYVQDALHADAAHIAQLISEGAQIMVCGGRDMAAGVATVLAEVLAPTKWTPALLKAEGRYVEDTY
ncbi:sulfite reductase (NADPH) flavoprotein alpha-component [Pseudorhodobacter antarcticus]|uniref:NADPH--hemoprotein reductase n=1 Tax=Pseudorhodobacter antarcticus TaxID=1077947 RepID=A0A1H8K097_9RHOB|nr:PepSY domain-containing protein [Pseudorhodobacter antarcticus]SEN86383.1 sulfite reductase (NADPH) flavoprotein alpha-component [Pseudorhodobacter antarcticus]